MSADPSFDDLMARPRDGDPAAAEAIFRRYTARLIGLARGRLDACLRGKVDPEDVANSALKSFFLRHAGGQFDLDDWDALWSLLTVITLRKCGHRARHFRAARRDVRREAGGAEADRAAVAREPTPDEAAELAEVVEGLFRGLDPADRVVLQGCTADEASREAGVSRRTAYRVLERAKGRLPRQMDDPPPAAV